MNLQATFTNPLGQAKTLEIKDGLSLQDAYNVVANDDFAPTQITLEATNMNSSDSNVEPDKQVETAYDLIGRHSSNDIIDKHKISSDELAVLLEEGTNHELEHTSSYLIAMKIAQDHLYEDLMYYSKLKEAMLARGAVLSMKKPTEKIRFEKGGYVSEDILIDNNIDKIDDIYVLTEDDKPVKSLGQFTFKGFGKYVMQDLAAELYDDYKIRLRNDFAIMLGEDVIKPSIKVAQMKGDKIELLAIIYNALVTDEKPLAYVYNEDGEMVGKFTDEDEAEEMVNDNDGYYSEVRVEEVTTTETILAMEFDFQKHEMTFVSSLLDKKNTHKFKYGGKL
jgi:hypothetical protein